MLTAHQQGDKLMTYNLRETVTETIKVLARDANRRNERHTLAFLIEHLERAGGKDVAQAFRMELARK